MWLVARIGAAPLVLLALRGRRWAYYAFVAVCLLYFPARVGFRLHPQACELAPTARLLLFSLRNYPHVVIFCAFFALSWVQFRRSGRAGFAWAGLATLVMGALVELVEGVTGRGHCRVRDLVPDAAGALLAAVPLALWRLRSSRRRREHAESQAAWRSGVVRTGARGARGPSPDGRAGTGVRGLARAWWLRTRMPRSLVRLTHWSARDNLVPP